MSEIRCIYRRERPAFPATDQHPDAWRYGPITLPDGLVVYVDAVGGEPAIAQIQAMIDPAPDHAPAGARLDRHLASAISEFSATPAPAATESKSAMTSPSVAGLNVRELMEEHTRLMGDIHKAQIELLKSSLARQRDTLSTAVTAVAQKIDGQTDEFLSIMGQFSNDLGIG